jgi:hypothetical protein
MFLFPDDNLKGKKEGLSKTDKKGPGTAPIFLFPDGGVAAGGRERELESRKFEALGKIIRNNNNNNHKN